MERRILRIDEEGYSVATEKRFESEERLHAAILEHPEVLPSTDLGLGTLVCLAIALSLSKGDGGPLNSSALRQRNACRGAPGRAT